MKTFYWDSLTHDSFFEQGSAVTIGGFDGPHLGHTSLFDAVFDFKKNNPLCKAGIITFQTLPRSIKEKHDFAGELSTHALRMKKFENYGFDFVVLIDFSANFSILQGSDFLARLCDWCAVKFLAVGEDFRCGSGLDTGMSEIQTFAKKHKISVFFAKSLTCDEQRISSSLIRRAILQADFQTAYKLLGFSYTLDMQNCTWTKKNEISKTVFSTKKAVLSQIIPPVGQYRVWIQKSPDNDFSVLQGLLQIDENDFHLFVDSWNDEWTIQTLLFQDL
ncbi:MAG: FAD synthetase family protein [Treponemataceae bacterium]